MTRPRAGLLAPMLAAAACGAAGDGSAVVPAPASAQGCEVRPSGPAGPVTDPNGPYYHQVAVARTADGVALSDHAQILEHASVPDGVVGPGEGVLVYYVNGAQGSIWVARLEGTGARPLGPISLNGIAAPAGVVDPDALRLADGRIRLAYLGGFGPPGTAGPRAMCLADSADGVNFNVVGAALSFPESEMLTDPSLAPLADGTWLMAISRGRQTVLARSRDGLAFERGETLDYGGVPELARLPDGRVRLYVCAGGIESHVSSDGGRSWRREGVVIPAGFSGRRIVCDPSLVEGAGLFVYKTAN